MAHPHCGHLEFNRQELVILSRETAVKNRKWKQLPVTLRIPLDIDLAEYIRKNKEAPLQTMVDVRLIKIVPKETSEGWHDLEFEYWNENEGSKMFKPKVMKKIKFDERGQFLQVAIRRRGNDDDHPDTLPLSCRREGVNRFYHFMCTVKSSDSTKAVFITRPIDIMSKYRNSEPSAAKKEKTSTARKRSAGP